MFIVGRYMRNRFKCIFDCFILLWYFLAVVFHSQFFLCYHLRLFVVNTMATRRGGSTRLLILCSRSSECSSVDIKELTGGGGVRRFVVMASSVSQLEAMTITEKGRKTEHFIGIVKVCLYKERRGYPQ